MIAHIRVYGRYMICTLTFGNYFQAVGCGLN